MYHTYHLQVCGLSFYSLNISSNKQKFFILMKPNSPVFLFVVTVFCILFRGHFVYLRIMKLLGYHQETLSNLDLKFQRSWFCVWRESMSLSSWWRSCWSEPCTEKTLMSLEHCSRVWEPGVQTLLHIGALSQYQTVWTTCFIIISDSVSPPTLFFRLVLCWV